MDGLGLKVVGLRKTYPKTLRRPALEAVKGFDLDVRDGEVVGLLGPNGAGEFNRPRGVATANLRKRVYVADRWNDRVQYFRRVE